MTKQCFRSLIPVTPMHSHILDLPIIIFCEDRKNGCVYYNLKGVIGICNSFQKLDFAKLYKNWILCVLFVPPGTPIWNRCKPVIKDGYWVQVCRIVSQANAIKFIKYIIFQHFIFRLLLLNINHQYQYERGSFIQAQDIVIALISYIYHAIYITAACPNSPVTGGVMFLR